MPEPAKPNKLFFGDNLPVLRQHIQDESVDLIYLDPPFNSKKEYNLLYAEEDGRKSVAQIKAFNDTWHWDPVAEETYADLVASAPERVSVLLQNFRAALGHNDVMAYLVMMAVRLVELHRVLRPAGSIYLHCDPTASHYLKLLMDAIFGPKRFRSEVVWSYRRWPTRTPNFQHMHDVLLYYGKGGDVVFNVSHEPASDSFLRRFRGKGNRLEPGETKKHATGDATLGMPLRDVWDISIIAGSAKERLRYPTQKPEALLERVIQTSSNEGDLVLDPFCGCGTTVAVAQRLRRRWIGIDITHLAIGLIRRRLRDHYGDGIEDEYDVIGVPADVEGARALARQDRYQFQWWALDLVDARSVGQPKKKGADKGIDGVVFFIDEADTSRVKKIIVSVKSGHVERSHVAELRGVLERERAHMGFLVTLEPPTAPMREEAVSAGFYESPFVGARYPRIQILTIADLLAGKKPERPPKSLGDLTIKKAPRAQSEPPLVQGTL